MSDDTDLPRYEAFTLSQFARLPGRVYAPTAIDGDTSEWVRVVKDDLIKILLYRREKGVVLTRDGDGWLFHGVHYPDSERSVLTPRS